MALSYERLRPNLSGPFSRQLGWWGGKASAGDLESAAHGLLAAESPEAQVQHLRIFSRRPFPLEISFLVELAWSANEDVAFAAAVALAQNAHPLVREAAFELVDSRLVGREFAIAMLDRNFETGDHEIVLSWFENELDRDLRHRMQMDLTSFWEGHAQAVGERRMLYSIYEKGPCSFCREFVVRRLIELDAVTAPMRAECTHDANEDVRLLVSQS